MARVRVLVAMAGSDHSWSVGDLYECDDVSAARLVAAGRVEYLDAQPAAPVAPVETAMRSGAPDRAMRPRGRGRG